MTGSNGAHFGGLWFASEPTPAKVGPVYCPTTFSRAA